MGDVIGTQRSGTEGVPQSDGRLVSENSGQFGVSDERRAELSQLEQDAGVQHEAADESVISRPAAGKEAAAGLAEQPGAPRPGDKH